MLFTESKTDQYFSRNWQKSAPTPENSWLRFLSSLRKLFPPVTSVLLVSTKSKIKDVELTSDPGREISPTVTSLGGSCCSFPTDCISTVQPFFQNMAKCNHWLTISREILIRLSSGKKDLLLRDDLYVIYG